MERRCFWCEAKLKALEKGVKTKAHWGENLTWHKRCYREAEEIRKIDVRETLGRNY